MTTVESFEALAHAVETMASDVKLRIQRIEARRQRLVVQENTIHQAFDAVRLGLDRLEDALKEQFLDWQRLEDAELAETAGEDDRRPGVFETIIAGKSNGAGREND